jgi:hypothetical protein
VKKLILLLFLVLGVAAGIIYYKKWRTDLLRKKIPQLVFLKSDSLYRITYDDVDIDEIEGEIHIKNLQLKPDTTYRKPNDSTLPRDLLQVVVPEVNITGVKTDSAILNKQVIAAKIMLNSPVVTMFSNHHGAKSRDITPTKDKIYQVLLRGLQSINVDTIMITDADYHICRWPWGDTLFSGSTINAHLYHINISDSTSTDTSRILFAKNADLTIKKVLLRGKKPIYHYHFNDIQINSDERIFTVKSMNITPLMNEAAFARAAKWQTDRLDFTFSNLQFKEVQVPELLNGNLIANELSISHARFKVFRDKSYPEKKTSRVGTYPFQLFAKLPVQAFLKKVIIQHAFIEYKEKEQQTGGTGIVVFDNAHATLHNVTNRTVDLHRNAVCTLNFNCQFLNKVPLSATLQFYLNSNHGKFTVNGTLGAVDATIFNPLSKTMALVQINSGNINHLDFQLTCDDYKGIGSVRLLYDDLKIKLLKMDDPDGRMQIKKVASFLANMSIINSNPVKKKPVRVVTVSHPRNVYASMYNLIWKSIFEGVQRTIGLDGKIP